MELKKIYVVLGAKFAEFDKAMEGVAGKLSAVSKTLGDVGSKLTKSVTLPLTAVGAAVGALTMKAAGAADELTTMAGKTGLSITRLQELRYVASQTDGSFEALSTAAVYLGRNIVAGSEEGSKMAKVLETIGVQGKNADGTFRSIDDLLPEVLAKLAGMEDITLRNSYAMELFGRGGTELIPTLNAGEEQIEALTKEAHSLNLVMSKESVEALAGFNDKVDAVKQQLAAAGAQVAEKFLPLLQDKLLPLITGKIVPALVKFAEWVGGVIDKFMALSPETQTFILAAIGLLAALGPILVILSKLVGGLGSVASALAFLAANPIVLVIAGVALLVAGIVTLIKHWDDVKAAAKRAWDGITDFIQPVVDKVQRVIDKIKSAIDWFGRLFGAGSGEIGAPAAALGGYEAYATGGVLAEPVLGLGLATGTRYSFAEHGPEEIRPLGSRGSGNVYNVYVTGNHIASDYDVDRIGERMVKYIRSRTGARF